MVLVVRHDLGMGKGKAAAQVKLDNFEIELLELDSQPNEKVEFFSVNHALV